MWSCEGWWFVGGSGGTRRKEPRGTVDSVTVITDDYIPLLPPARTTADPTSTPIVFPSPQMTISMDT
jgi:hypothetical protein